jgi:hypothetical protein
MIPMNARTVEHIVKSVEPYKFDRIYGGWWAYIMPSGAKDSVKRSTERYPGNLVDLISSDYAQSTFCEGRP